MALRLNHATVMQRCNRIDRNAIEIPNNISEITEIYLSEGPTVGAMDINILHNTIRMRPRTAKEVLMLENKLERKHTGRISKRPDIDTLSSLYAKKSAREIAAMYGVTDATVRRWIAEYRRDLYGETGRKAECTGRIE